MRKIMGLALAALLLGTALLCSACAAPEAATTAPEITTQAEGFDYHYNLGVKYLSEGNYQEAILAFTAAIDIDAKRADALVGRGDAYIGLDDADSARPDYEEAIALDDALIEAYLGVIEACIRQNDFDAALEWAKAALDKTGDSRFEEKIAELDSGNISDSLGRQRKRLWFDESGRLQWYHTLTYDANGRATSVSLFSAEGVRVTTLALSYTADGLPLKDYTSSADGGLLWQTENEYNEVGQLVKETFFDEAGAVSSQFIYEYNSANQVARWYECLSDGVIGYLVVNQYNDQGQIIRCDNYGGTEDDFLDYFVFEYDTAGRQIKQSCFDPGGDMKYYLEILYNADGQRAGTIEYDADGNMLSRTEWN